jgi:hypothetical protein
VQQEGSLHADAVGRYAPDRESGIRSLSAAANDRALEGLDALALTLDDANVDFDRIAGVQLGDVGVSLQLTIQ